MINKRLLVKNLLAHHDENSFYDKKLKINLDNKEGKAKFLKHICALSNSNPKNNSYIVIGIDDSTNTIVGIPFFDDAKLQNLINAYLSNAPVIHYENVSFPHLSSDLVVGLVTIYAQDELTALRKNIWKYYGGMVFLRDGSISMPKAYDIEIKDQNSKIVQNIERQSSNNIRMTLDRVVDFVKRDNGNIKTNYQIFKEQFVICWSGKVKKKGNETYYSRVDIELVNEQVKLFYSALDEVQIHFDENSFEILEYIYLGLGNQRKYYPLERQTFKFFPNGTYRMENKILFNPPYYDRRTLHHIYNKNQALLSKLHKSPQLDQEQIEELKRMPEEMLICHFNSVGEAIEKMKAQKAYFKKFPVAYKNYKESLRVLRKVNYNS